MFFNFLLLPTQNFIPYIFCCGCLQRAKIARSNEICLHKISKEKYESLSDTDRHRHLDISHTKHTINKSTASIRLSLSHSVCFLLAFFFASTNFIIIHFRQKVFVDVYCNRRVEKGRCVTYRQTVKMKRNPKCQRIRMEIVVFLNSHRQ